MSCSIFPSSGSHGTSGIFAPIPHPLYPTAQSPQDTVAGGQLQAYILGMSMGCRRESDSCCIVERHPWSDYLNICKKPSEIRMDRGVLHGRCCKVRPYGRPARKIPFNRADYPVPPCNNVVDWNPRRIITSTNHTLTSYGLLCLWVCSLNSHSKSDLVRILNQTAKHMALGPQCKDRADLALPSLMDSVQWQSALMHPVAAIVGVMEPENAT